MAALSTVLWTILLVSCSKLLQSNAHRNPNEPMYEWQNPPPGVRGRPVPSTIRTDQPNVCAADWPPLMFTTGKKFFYVNTNLRMNWFGAYEYCAMRQSRLARVQSPEEKKTLDELIRATPGSDILWLGGNDLAEEGKWKWLLNGEALGRYSSWATGEPNNYGVREHCLAVSYNYYYRQGYSWNDLDCQQRHGFVCEHYR